MKFHLYTCTECEVTFGVDQAFEDHSLVVCPICSNDEHLVDGEED